MVCFSGPVENHQASPLENPRYYNAIPMPIHGCNGRTTAEKDGLGVSWRHVDPFDFVYDSSKGR
ncbi:MAG: hypothetical protein MUO52_11905, partial [Desulfobacterales bacterium]|nr:hypothetical protein [Desulfobacterales bacterium]